MTGQGLFDFGIETILLAAIGFLFFYAIDGLSSDARFTQVAKLAVGVCLLVVFLFACKALLFGGAGGISLSPAAVLTFAIAVIVALIFMFVVRWFVSQFAGTFAEPIMFVVGGVVIIALLVVASNVFFGGAGINQFLNQKRGALELPYQYATIEHRSAKISG